MKKQYKELKKKLKDTYIKQGSGANYEVSSSVGYWVAQCGIHPTEEHTKIIYNIFGSIPYPYQKLDRKIVLDYLHTNKFKDFKLMVKKRMEKFEKTRRRIIQNETLPRALGNSNN